ncbi:legumain [Trichonephila inaurata madagascariensis]|uniref:Legumain n=1 Tax=Trichonephila inaurata madagascariensis TaxID=2747483 RepID=A0A8X7CEZ6_9ARAC|nr:legumain [Trichonephila inaurata madagascariensis]
MLNELYVDDLINSTFDATEALQLSEEMIHILSEVGMNLRRWATNSTTLHKAWKRANIDCRKTSEESGVPKDYTGEDVTPKNFMAVLKGDEKTLAGVGIGKVRKSGPSDHVFVYFADHGAPGLIVFPEDELSAKDLNRTINYMYENNMYGKMVIYIEVCKSGSMFENILLNNINVYATTAPNSEESSYACYFDDKRGTYLGNSYSAHWMEDSDQDVLTTETLQKQYKIVKKEITESHAQEFGNMSIAQLHVSEEKAPRHLWRLRRIIEIHKGRDGKIRSATIETSTGIMKRHVQLLYNLEIVNNE